jgi:hypothetical protein
MNNNEAQAAKDINLINHRLLATANPFCVLLNYDFFEHNNYRASASAVPGKCQIDAVASISWPLTYWKNKKATIDPKRGRKQSA